MLACTALEMGTWSKPGAQTHSFSAFYIGSHHVQPVLQLPEVVSAPQHGERPAQVIMQAFIVEQPGERDWARMVMASSRLWS